MGIVGAGGGFGVVLDTEQGQRQVAQTFQRLVVQVDVGQLHFVGVDGVGSTAKLWLWAVISTLPVALLRTG